jgi:hypothetical protein
MLCSHTTCKGFTAVRRSRFGHSEVATTHRDGDKFSRLGNISTECKNCDTSQAARKGRQLGGEDKVKVTGKAKVKVKVQAKVQAKVAWKCIPPPHLSSPMRGFRGMRGKMLRGAKNF